MKWNKTYPDRDVLKDFFIVSNRVFYLGLNQNEIGVYSYLMSIVNHKTHECLSQIELIGKALEIKSRSVITKTFCSLVEKGLITVEKTVLQSKDGSKEKKYLGFHVQPFRESFEDFFMIPKEIFYMDLQRIELVVYFYLISIEDHKTFESYTKMSTIGKAIDINSRNTIAKAIKGLVEKRLITTENTKVQSKNGRVQNGCLRFHIRPIEEAIRAYHEREIERLQRECEKANLRKAVEKINNRSK